jgi:hypothetical protein
MYSTRDADFIEISPAAYTVEGNAGVLSGRSRLLEYSL